MKFKISCSRSMIIEFCSMNGTLLKVVFAEKVKCGKAEKREESDRSTGCKIEWLLDINLD